MNRILASLTALAAGSLIAATSATLSSDTIPSAFSRPPQWRLGVELAPSWVPPTNSFLKGSNPEEKKIKSSFAGGFRADFSFDPTTREGMLYRDLYQGLAVEANYFSPNSLLGSPVSAYVYQGAPIVRFSDRAWLGYEWQFGAAFGWKHDGQQKPDNNAAVSTSVTAHMGLGVKVHYRLRDRVVLSAGLAANHYSNGNTSWPNSGVNSIGATVGIAYQLNAPNEPAPLPDRNLLDEADRGGWFYDIMVYGGWRKRVISVGDPAEPQLCPGKFGIVGVQFSPMRSLNRWVAVGPALDLQWDESAAIAGYWVQGTLGDQIKFERPPFRKQISAGLSAHAELTMPIFSVNAGLGYNIITPEGDKAFYQSLTLKTFLSRSLYINVGYRLGAFKDPQNLMLGLGVRI